MDDPSRIRPAWLADAPVLAALERRCFADPWTADAFRELLRQREAFGLVCEDGGEIAGYAVARCVAGTGELLNLAVEPERRGQGLARTLLSATLGALQQRGAGEVFLEVRPSNRAAVALYAAFQFAKVGRRPEYYRNPLEDALILRREIGAGERFG